MLLCQPGWAVTRPTPQPLTSPPRTPSPTLPLHPLPRREPTTITTSISLNNIPPVSLFYCVYNVYPPRTSDSRDAAADPSRHLPITLSTHLHRARAPCAHPPHRASALFAQLRPPHRKLRPPRRAQLQQAERSIRADPRRVAAPRVPDRRVDLPRPHPRHLAGRDDHVQRPPGPAVGRVLDGVRVDGRRVSGHPGPVCGVAGRSAHGPCCEGLRSGNGQAGPGRCTRAALL